VKKIDKRLVGRFMHRQEDDIKHILQEYNVNVDQI
jgi:hypothetical protein